MIRIEGAHGVSATILADSISKIGIRLISMEITYWRGILAEFNTHGMLCKNSASSRAIPFAKMRENLTGRPHRFGQANPGMQDKGFAYSSPLSTDTYSKCSPEQAWDIASSDALDWSKAYNEAGYHKQVYNRLTEPFQMMKTVVSATEWNNFFWLRDNVEGYDAADPSIAELARVMRLAKEQSTPQLLYPGEWHLPYVMTQVLRDRYPGGITYWIEDDTDERGVRELSKEDALAVSSARCASVSFRNVDYDLEKSKSVADRLIGADRKHGSAFQHQATPMKEESRPDWINISYPMAMMDSWEPGVSHVDRDGQLWSAQFRGWIMHRKLIPGENVPG